MGIINLFVCIILTYYTLYVVEIIFNKTTRLNIINKNNELDNLRMKGLLTLEEQKQFINLKYPKKTKSKITLRDVGKILFKLFLFIIFMRVWIFSFNLYNINFMLWQAVFFAVLFPIVINFVLGKLNLQKNDLSIFLKGWLK